MRYWVDWCKENHVFTCDPVKREITCQKMAKERAMLRPSDAVPHLEDELAPDDLPPVRIVDVVLGPSLDPTHHRPMCPAIFPLDEKAANRFQLKADGTRMAPGQSPGFKQEGSSRTKHSSTSKYRCGSTEQSPSPEPKVPLFVDGDDDHNSQSAHLTASTKSPTFSASSTLVPSTPSSLSNSITSVSSLSASTSSAASHAAQLRPVHESASTAHFTKQTLVGSASPSKAKFKPAIAASCQVNERIVAKSTTGPQSTLGAHSSATSSASTSAQLPLRGPFYFNPQKQTIYCDLRTGLGKMCRGDELAMVKTARAMAAVINAGGVLRKEEVEDIIVSDDSDVQEVKQEEAELGPPFLALIFHHLFPPVATSFFYYSDLAPYSALPTFADTSRPTFLYLSSMLHLLCAASLCTPSRAESPKDLVPPVEAITTAASTEGDETDPEPLTDRQSEVDSSEDEPEWHGISLDPQAKVIVSKRPIPSLGNADDDVPGLTIWAKRNPGKPLLRSRAKERRVIGPEQRRMLDDKAKSTKKRMAALQADITQLNNQRVSMVEELATRHRFKPKLVKQRLSTATVFKKSQKPSLYWAKLHYLSKVLNEGLDKDEWLSLHDIRKRVIDYPEFQNMSLEFKKELLESLEEHRSTKKTGTWATNKAVAQDASYVVKKIYEEIKNLFERSGMYGIAIFSKGHVQDKTIPYILESASASDFI
ncbi:hypothetical protein C8R45DRAFT_1113426 [Mycena sanguinolenta]|nr:hypothetical protein C8R45DRAFT_1113426 [Mycena sanguinolenta]